MDENKQFDNNGEQIIRYRHDDDGPSQPREHKCSDRHRDDTIVIRIKRSHIKLAALVIAAFMFGLYVAGAKNSYKSTGFIRTYSFESPQAEIRAYNINNAYNVPIEIDNETREHIVNDSNTPADSEVAIEAYYSIQREPMLERVIRPEGSLMPAQPEIQVHISSPYGN